MAKSYSFRKSLLMRPIHTGTALPLFILVTGRIGGGPPFREEGERREKPTADLKGALAAEATAAGKAAASVSSTNGTRDDLGAAPPFSSALLTLGTGSWIILGAPLLGWFVWGGVERLR
jgi:hypothetical protein